MTLGESTFSHWGRSLQVVLLLPLPILSCPPWEMIFTFTSFHPSLKIRLRFTTTVFFICLKGSILNTTNCYGLIILLIGEGINRQSFCYRYPKLTHPQQEMTFTFISFQPSLTSRLQFTTIAFSICLKGFEYNKNFCSDSGWDRSLLTSPWLLNFSTLYIDESLLKHMPLS